MQTQLKIFLVMNAGLKLKIYDIQIQIWIRFGMEIWINTQLKSSISIYRTKYES